MRKTVIGFLILTGLFFRVSVIFAENGNIPGWLKRTHYGVDAGTDQKPRVYFETVQPLYQDDDKQNTVFIQPRFSYLNDDFGSNLGVGYRRLMADNTVLLGTNVFFDYENEHRHYRAGVGLEGYFNRLESRLNTYFGLSPTRVSKIVGASTYYERAVDGLDWEIGGPTPYMNWIKVYGGGYWYDYKKFDNKTGWRARTEFSPLSFLTVNFLVYDDNKGEVAYRADARVSLAFGGDSKEGGEESVVKAGIDDKAFEEKVDHSDRALDRVEREHKIEVEKWVETASAMIEIRRGD
ncbi:MAG: inverse autotransporter beta domain-containing protein [Candidatus Omnitrophica bacterium]|nr:inverse autotransporter beta domain-containing protein [Candidatus Omnitrophota bacterium]